jgi:hypothetical protein
MLSDRFTAQVLAGLTVVMTVLIDISCFIFTKPEISHRATFPLVVIVPSLPLFGAAAWLFRRAKTLKDSD